MNDAIASVQASARPAMAIGEARRRSCVRAPGFRRNCATERSGWCLPSPRSLVATWTAWHGSWKLSLRMEVW